jgi:hypothetical protein
VIGGLAVDGQGTGKGRTSPRAPRSILVKSGKFELQVTGPTTAYLKLPTYSAATRHTTTVTLADLLGAYKGPYVVFDFDPDGVLVGIEIDDDDEDEDETDEEVESTAAKFPPG